MSAFRLKKTQKLIYNKESLYHQVLVYEEDHVRTLRLGKSLDAGKQSQIDVWDLDRHLFEYTRLAFAGLLLNPNPRKVLIIGLGGGVIPREMRGHFPDTEIDVVEIDPEVVKVAKKFFFFKTDDKLRVLISDGREFVQRQSKMKSCPIYDLIILDAYNSEHIPIHMATMEFLQRVAAILHSEGVVVANVLSDHRLFDSECRTFWEVYGRCYVFMGRYVKNAILVSPGPRVDDLNPEMAQERANLLQRRHDFSFNMNDVVRRFRPRFRPKLRAQILTDEKLPDKMIWQ